MRTILRNTIAAALLLAGVVQQAAADIVTLTGDTSGMPTFVRPGDWGGESYPWITGVSYQAFNVSGNASNWMYSFMASCEYSCVSFFYDGSFDPDRPHENLMNASADGRNFTGMEVFMEPGRNYVYVLTGYFDEDAGAYSLTVGSMGDISISAVPEPSAGLMLLGGLAGVGALARRRARRAA